MRDFAKDRELLAKVPPGPYTTCTMKAFAPLGYEIVAKCCHTDVYCKTCRCDFKRKLKKGEPNDCPYHDMFIEAVFFARAYEMCQAALDRIVELEAEIAFLGEKEQFEEHIKRIEAENARLKEAAFVKKDKKSMLCERCGGMGKQEAGCWNQDTQRYDAPAGICTTCDGEGYLSGAIKTAEDYEREKRIT